MLRTRPFDWRSNSLTKTVEPVDWRGEVSLHAFVARLADAGVAMASGAMRPCTARAEGSLGCLRTVGGEHRAQPELIGARYARIRTARRPSGSASGSRTPGCASSWASDSGSVSCVSAHSRTAACRSSESSMRRSSMRTIRCCIGVPIARTARTTVATTRTVAPMASHFPKRSAASRLTRFAPAQIEQVVAEDRSGDDRDDRDLEQEAQREIAGEQIVEQRDHVADQRDRREEQCEVRQPAPHGRQARDRIARGLAARRSAPSKGTPETRSATKPPTTASSRHCCPSTT